MERERGVTPIVRSLLSYIGFVAISSAIGTAAAVGLVVWPLYRDAPTAATMGGAVHGGFAATGFLLVPAGTGLLVGVAHWTWLRKRLALALVWVLSLGGGVVLGGALAIYATSNAPLLRPSAAAVSFVLGGSVGLVAGGVQAVALRFAGASTRDAVFWCAAVALSWAGAFVVPGLVPARQLGLPVSSAQMEAPDVAVDEVANTWLALGFGMGALHGAVTGVPLVRIHGHVRRLRPLPGAAAEQ